MIRLSTRSLSLACLLGASIGLTVGCSLLLDFEPPEQQCWCGEQWRVQVSGAYAYDLIGQEWAIPATATTYTTCVSMSEHLALDGADLGDPVYTALRDGLKALAIANCEAAGKEHWSLAFGSTDCASAGQGSVSTNLVHAGSCWEAEDHENGEFCPLPRQCGEFYDCGDQDPITNWGDTGGEDDGVPWSCDEPVAGDPVQD